MIGIVRDTWRAVLVLVVVAVLRLTPSVATPAAAPVPPPAVPAVHWPAPAPPIYIQQPQPERPLRRVAQAVTELGDSFLGVIR